MIRIMKYGEVANEEIFARVEREYLARFPKLTGKYSAHLCRTADGVRLG